MQHVLPRAARDGDLRLLKRLARALDKGRGRLREAVEAAKEEGVGALHHAARNERITVCRYLVEELGVDVDAVDDEDIFLIMVSIRAKMTTMGSLHSIMLLEQAMDLDPDDATLLSNRSLCWLRMGDGEKALRDAVECREMRADWPKSCYRQGAALLLLQDYNSACEALIDGFKLDMENAEIENALRCASVALH
ncbi:hypothetical protein BAE44_0019424 [Dichanthelium oligosanthes]|uniref:Uncharacterized protein n=1 Tax=Dichanthelium oligosanthes TaxID=888268 RepID=A0A1E5V3I2_9POAL|nr:hypothetical protein BAE44_0019424 [Dichanthelium oligosanthes]